jgi:hypothetical protein
MMTFAVAMVASGDRRRPDGPQVAMMATPVSPGKRGPILKRAAWRDPRSRQRGLGQGSTRHPLWITGSMRHETIGIAVAVPGEGPWDLATDRGHIDDFNGDQVFGWFAGLHVPPKKTFATDDSSRTERAQSRGLLQGWVKVVVPVMFPVAEGFSLDFPPIPDRGDPRRSTATICPDEVRLPPAGSPSSRWSHPAAACAMPTPL